MNTLLGAYENMVDYFKGQNFGVKLAIFGIIAILLACSVVLMIKSYKVGEKFTIKFSYVILSIVLLIMLIFLTIVMFK